MCRQKKGYFCVVTFWNKLQYSTISSVFFDPSSFLGRCCLQFLLLSLSIATPPPPPAHPLLCWYAPAYQVAYQFPPSAPPPLLLTFLCPFLISATSYTPFPPALAYLFPFTHLQPSFKNSSFPPFNLFQYFHSITHPPLTIFHHLPDSLPNLFRNLISTHFSLSSTNHRVLLPASSIIHPIPPFYHPLLRLLLSSTNHWVLLLASSIIHSIPPLCSPSSTSYSLSLLTLFHHSFIAIIHFLLSLPFFHHSPLSLLSHIHYPRYSIIHPIPPLTLCHRSCSKMIHFLLSLFSSTTYPLQSFALFHQSASASTSLLP